MQSVFFLLNVIVNQLKSSPNNSYTVSVLHVLLLLKGEIEKSTWTQYQRLPNPPIIGATRIIFIFIFYGVWYNFRIFSLLINMKHSLL